MDEGDVGITRFTTPAARRFAGILKHRFQDFQVSEIDLAGRTACLISTEAPAQPGAAAAVAAGAPQQPQELTDESIAAVADAFAALAGADNAALLASLLHSIRSHVGQGQQPTAAAVGTAPASAAGDGGGDPASNGAPQQQQQPAVGMPLEVHLLPVADKEARKAIHNFIKTDSRLPALDTSTVTQAAPAAAAAAAGAQPSAAAAAGAGSSAPPVSVIRVRPAGGGDSRGRGGGRGNKGGRGQKRGRDDWNSGASWAGGAQKHVRFVMLKENMDTQSALQVLARMLHTRPHAFGFAGTKDKRGVTSQHVTLFKADPARLAALNPRLRGIKLGNFEFTDSQLQLGQLRGNAFKILMRDVDTRDEAQIAAAVAEVRERGFINYFGLQRFGTGHAPTHRVGAALLRGEWEAAVQLIMTGGPYENDGIRAARQLYTQQGNAKGALAAMPTFMAGERAILEILARQGSGAWVAALQAVPRTLRSMYLHAWQSYVWNQAASARVEQHGVGSVVAGDLVLLLPPGGGGGGGGAADAGGSAEAAAAAAVAAEDASELLAAAAAVDDTPGGELDGSSAAARLAAVHRVTAEEAAACKFSIADVVLPVPGSQVLYPHYSAGWPLYCRLAAADGIVLPGMTDAEYAAAAAAAAAAGGGGEAAFSSTQPAGATAAAGAGSDSQGTPLQHSIKEFQLAGLTGDYRRLLHFPALQHRIVRYTDPNDPGLLLSDWDELQAQQQQQHKRQKQEHQPEEGAAAAADTRQSDQPQPEPEPAAAPADASADASSSKQHLGVVLEFSLPSSCYATMLIRELTKSSTSKAAHKQLSEQQQAAAGQAGAGPTVGGAAAGVEAEPAPAPV